MRLTKAEKELKEVALEINRTLPYYEKDWVSVKRTPESTVAERCTSFEQYIEARFNYEFSKKYKEFSELVSFLDGKLFCCTLLEGSDPIKRRFKEVELTLLDPDTVENPSEYFLDVFSRLEEYLGGNKIYFNSVKKKVRLKIKKDGKN